MNHTRKEAAGILRISTDKLDQVVAVHPYYYLNGKRKLFTDEDIKSIILALRPDQDNRVRRWSRAQTGPTMPHSQATERALAMLRT